MNYIELFKSRAKSNIKKIILPEALNELILKSVEIILKENFVEVVLIGDPEEIENKVKEYSLEIDLSKVNIFNPKNSEICDNLARTLHSIRESKGMTLDEAYELIQNPIYYGIMLLQTGYADGLVAGIEHSTSDVLRPALQIIKNKESTNLVSSFFLMEMPNTDVVEDGILLFSDAALIENPDSEQLAEIAIRSANSYEMLLLKEPKVALLSYSTKGSAKSEMTEKVINAYNIVKENNISLKIDGEIQADTALVKEISIKKDPNSSIQGEANVLIFPDLNSGNISYKLVQRLAGAKAYGPITQGFNKPVNDLSRGSEIDDIVGTIAITAIQSQEE